MSEYDDKKVYECPACSVQALAVHWSTTGSLSRFTCGACGVKWRAGELEFCPECSQPRVSSEYEELIICRNAVGFYVCRVCYERFFN